MRIIQYNVYKHETNSAGGKAKNDVQEILSEIGVGDLYTPSSKRLIRIMQQILNLFFLRSDSIIIIQYPAVVNSFIRLACKRVRKKGKSVVIIHDLVSLQSGKDDSVEFSLLKQFDYIAVHNQVMKSYLQEKGVHTNIVVLDIFDYLHEEKRSTTHNESFISIAGNLDKSTFIKKLSGVKPIVFGLYGICHYVDELQDENMNYLGCLKSNEIVYEIDGKYGLVWDGESIDECSGRAGEYLKYNNPHKLSLYIASGRPVITWKQAAIANFIDKYNIGILVESLQELPKKLENVSVQEYSKMMENVNTLKIRLANGYYTKRAINYIIEDIKKQNGEHHEA